MSYSLGSLSIYPIISTHFYWYKMHVHCDRMVEHGHHPVVAVKPTNTPGTASSADHSSAVLHLGVTQKILF